MSTQGGLAVSKTLVSDNEILPGEEAIWELTFDNSTTEPIEVMVFDALNAYTMESFAWSAVTIGPGNVTGSSGAGVDLIDETITIDPFTRYRYTIIGTSLSPMRGTMTNCARWCTADDEFPQYIASEAVYVGMLEVDACLDHNSHDLNTALYQLLPKRGRASKLFDFIEAGYDLVDVLEHVAKDIMGNDSNAKPFNPDYAGFAEAAAAQAELEAAEAAAEAAMEAAIAAAEAAEAADAVN